MGCTPMDKEAMRDDNNTVMGIIGIIVAMAIAIAPAAMAAYENAKAMETCRATHSYDTCINTIWR